MSLHRLVALGVIALALAGCTGVTRVAPRCLQTGQRVYATAVDGR